MWEGYPSTVCRARYRFSPLRKQQRGREFSVYQACLGTQRVFARITHNPYRIFLMFTHIDHLMICVPDLERGVEQYRRMGFNVQPGGVHPGKGTHNAIAFNDEDYLELLAIRDPSEERAAEAAAGSWGRDLSGFIAAGGGIRFVILQSDDLAADVAAMRSRGVEVGDPVDGRRKQGATEFRWKAADLGPKNRLPLFFIQHLTPMAERRKHTPGGGPHPNGVFKLERTYVVVRDANAVAVEYAKVLGMPQPPLQRGTVIMA